MKQYGKLRRKGHLILGTLWLVGAFCFTHSTAPVEQEVATTAKLNLASPGYVPDIHLDAKVSAKIQRLVLKAVKRTKLLVGSEKVAVERSEPEELPKILTKTGLKHEG